MDNDKLMNIFGAKELVDLFEELDRDNQNKILNSSFKEAGKLLVSEAQNNLKGSYKHVFNSLGISSKKDIQTTFVGRVKKGGNLAHLANAGTKERFTKDGQSRGKMHTHSQVGKDFWTNAVYSTEKEMEEIIFKEIKQRFDKLIQKNNKQ